MSNVKAASAYVAIEAKDLTSAVFKNVLQRITGFTKEAEQKFESGFGGIKNIASNVGGSFLSVGKGIFSGFKTGVGIVSDAVNTFATFDDQMRVVKAVSQATGDGFLRLTNQAKLLGRTTAFTAQQVAEMQTELGRAGFASDEIENMTESVLNLSAATTTAANTTSGILSATIRQFGLQASDAARVADTLTQAANGSFNTLESLGGAMKYAAPVAKDYNMTLEETSSILMLLGNLGIQDSLAGTGVRNLLTFLTTRGDILNELLPGVETVDAAGNLRPLVDIMDDINKAMKGFGTQEKGEIFAKIFGMRALIPATKMTQALEEYEENLTKLKDAQHTGLARTTRDEMEGGIGGAIRSLKSAIQGIQIEIGEALAPALIFANKKFADMANVVASIIAKRAGIIQFFEASKAGLAGMIGGIVRFARDVNDYFRPVKEMGLTVIDTFAGIRDALEVNDFKGAFEVGIQGLTLVWEQFKSFVLSVWEDIKYGALTTFHFLATQIRMIMIDLGNDIKLAISGAFNAIAAGIFKNQDNGIMSRAIAQPFARSLLAASGGIVDSINPVQQEQQKAVLTENLDSTLLQLSRDSQAAKEALTNNLEAQKAAFDTRRSDLAQAAFLPQLQKIQGDILNTFGTMGTGLGFAIAGKIQESLGEESLLRDMQQRIIGTFSQVSSMMGMGGLGPAGMAFSGVAAAMLHELGPEIQKAADSSRNMPNAYDAVSKLLPDALEEGSVEAAKQAYANQQTSLLSRLVAEGKSTAQNTSEIASILGEVRDSLLVGGVQ